MKDQYEHALAETVIKLFEAGKSDPSAEEIAEAYFPDKQLGNEIPAGISKRLMKVGRIIEQIYDTPICLVNRRYYARFRHFPPTTDDDADSCVPGGKGNISFGIRKLDGNEDLIWQATIRRDGKSAAGKEKRLTGRVLGAYGRDEVTGETAVRLLEDMHKAATPEKKEELYARLMAELTEKDQLALTDGEIEEAIEETAEVEEVENPEPPESVR